MVRKSDEGDGAGNGVRTRGIKLGKLALYQLSYARPLSIIIEESTGQVKTFALARAGARTLTSTCGP